VIAGAVDCIQIVDGSCSAAAADAELATQAIDRFAARNRQQQPPKLVAASDRRQPIACGRLVEGAESALGNILFVAQPWSESSDHRACRAMDPANVSPPNRFDRQLVAIAELGDQARDGAGGIAHRIVPRACKLRINFRVAKCKAFNQLA
jgi:hypothetical protein